MIQFILAIASFQGAMVAEDLANNVHYAQVVAFNRYLNASKAIESAPSMNTPTSRIMFAPYYVHPRLDWAVPNLMIQGGPMGPPIYPFPEFPEYRSYPTPSINPFGS